MAYYAYHRVSTKEQHLDRGISEIEKFCGERGIVLEHFFIDQQTGKNFDRPKYRELAENALKRGDTLIITELDRFGRNKNAILEEMRRIKDMGVNIMVLEIPITLSPWRDMGDELAQMMLETVGNMMVEMYASLAQAEMHKRERRQREGIEAMKLRGEWNRYGHPKSVDKARFERLYDKYQEGYMTRDGVMTKLNISYSTFYHYRKELLAKRAE